MTFVELAVALSHPARAEILALLEGGVAITMGALAQALGLCPASITNHIDHLERMEIVRRIRIGREILVEAICEVEIVVHPVRHVGGNVIRPARGTCRSR